MIPSLRPPANVDTDEVLPDEVRPASPPAERPAEEVLREDSPPEETLPEHAPERE